MVDKRANIPCHVLFMSDDPNRPEVGQNDGRIPNFALYDGTSVGQSGQNDRGSENICEDVRKLHDEIARK